MGGGSVTVAASRLGVFTTVCASDIDPLVVSYWTAIRAGWAPPKSVTFDEWSAVRGNPNDYPAEYVAHVAYNCSFAGKRWGGYARAKKSDGITPYNFADATSRRDSTAAQWLGSTHITCADYADVLADAGPGDVVYCDPPYVNTTGYATGAFDHGSFWSAVQNAADAGALVYVSEYVYPDHIDADVVWSNTQAKSVRGGTDLRPRVTDNVFFIRTTSTN